MSAKERATAPGDRTSRREAIRGWRNWRIPVKLAAVVLVPVIFAITLGVVQIHEQVQRAERYEEIGRLLQARDRIQPLLTGLQEERTLAAAYLSGSANLQDLRTQARAVTKAASQAPQVLEAVGEFSPTSAAQFGALRKQLARLPKLRKQVFTSSIEPVAAVRAYSDMVGALLGLERSVISTLGDPRVYGPVSALHEMSSAEDEIRVQQALIGTALAQEDFDPALLDAVNDSRARLQTRIAEFLAAASPQQQRKYQRTVAVPATAPREQSLDSILASASSGDSEDITLTASEWNAQSRALTSRTTRIRTDLSQDLQKTASTLYDEASDRAGVITVLLMSALLLAAAVIFVITRNLLGSLADLRRSARRAANRDLPAAVEHIRQGDGSRSSVPEVPVHTTEEIGQVARAFDEVNRQALHLAAEQASLRRGYSDSFINVSRRSQSLLERQLRLFEQLEQDEDDPDQLATLFRLDHLATRMRRNNENLMVLSGNDLARRFNQPAPVADVLRAAVSEIEHYPRVVVQSPPQARLVGYAGSDLVRLVAELLDNAANFSAPNTSVTVSSYQADDGSITIDVLDRGVGMDDGELARTNARLASLEEPDMSTSRRLGMLVISKLAMRHGISVEVHGGEEFDGVRASVLIPPELVISAASTGQAPSQQVSAPSHPSMPQPSQDSRRNGAAQSLPQQSVPGQPLPARPPHEHREPQRNGAAQHETQVSRNNGSARRQVLEGGLPQRRPGNELGDAGPAPSAPAQPAPAEQTPSGPGTQPPPTPPEPASAEPEKPVRGLFEPPPKVGEAGQSSATPDERVDPSGMPQPRRSGEQTPGTPPHADGGGSRESFRPAPHETAPIFAETTAQWFQPSREDAYYQAESQHSQAEDFRWPTGDDPAPGLAPGGGPDRSGDRQQPATGGAVPSWNFETDQAQHQADAIAHPESASYTPSGLPRRTPRNQFAPGVATDGSPEANTQSAPVGERTGIAEEPSRSGQDPDELRGRLAGFQRGARQGQSGVPPEAGGSRPDPTARRAPDTGEPAWNFATDRVRSEAEAAANHEPSEFTAAGLPRRTPRAQLAPGSAPSTRESGRSESRDQPTPDELRGRLSNFQQGVRRGRHSADD